MFKLLAFFALLATVFCAPAPAPAPTPDPGLALTYLPAELPTTLEYRYPALSPWSYAKSYSYNNLGYASLPYAYPANYYYNAPLAYAI